MRCLVKPPKSTAEQPWEEFRDISISPLTAPSNLDAHMKMKCILCYVFGVYFFPPVFLQNQNMNLKR